MKTRKTKISPRGLYTIGLKLFAVVSFMKRQTIYLGPPDDELGRTPRNTATSTGTEGNHPHLRKLGLQTGI